METLLATLEAQDREQTAVTSTNVCHDPEIVASVLTDDRHRTIE
jgi:hypothetical protein